MLLGGVNAQAQTAVTVKDQISTNGQTVTYADGTKTVAYTNANNAIWYLGKYDLATIEKIEIRGAAFVSSITDDGTKAEAELKIACYGIDEEVTTTTLNTNSSDIRSAGSLLAKIVAETTPSEMASGKNATNYKGADFVISTTNVSVDEDGYDGTVILDSENSNAISKTEGVYNLYVYGTAQSRRLAVDEIIFYYKDKIENIATSTADTYVRKNDTGSYGSSTTLELYTYDAEDLDFVGLMSFDIPVLESSAYVLESATLKLVTERAKGKITIYPYEYEWSESSTYSDLSDNIQEARKEEAIQSDITLKGTSGKAMTDEGASNAIKDWINEIDLTEYVTTLVGGKLSLMIVNPANTKTSVKVYTKEAQNVTLQDGTVFSKDDLVPQLTIVYKKADYTLNVNEYNAATLVLPYETQIPEGVSAYTLTDAGNNTVNALPLTGNLPANTPVLINAEQGSYVFNATGAVSEAEANPVSGVLTGVYAKTDVPQGSYILWADGTHDIGFWQTTETATAAVGANRAYLTVPVSTEAKKIAIDFGEVTGIDSVEVAGQADDVIYNMSGMRVANPVQKGIYIKNGRKFIVK